MGTGRNEGGTGMGKRGRTQAAGRDEEAGYARAWEQAQGAAEALRDALIAVGLGTAVPSLKPEVNIFGDAMVQVGLIGPQTAHRFAQLLLAAASRSEVPRRTTDT